MSALAGLVRFGGTAEHEEARAMVHTMAHRAPDREGAWAQGPAALAHRALWTTPESLHERQPLVHAAQQGTVALVCDARIDNRDELIRTLDMPPPREGEVTTDADLILAAYLAWGEACPDRLVGDFAFVVWDGRGEGHVFAARDPFGVRMLYYHAAPGVFAFGTEAKALLALDGVPDALDEVTLAYHLVGVKGEPERTAFEAVSKLPGGHALRATATETTVWRHYTLRPDPSVGAWTNEAYTARFGELFAEAVRCRMRSAYPVGAQLSGGLDSSSIACVARDVQHERGGPPLPTFSLTFDEAPHSDERVYAQHVLDTGGFAPHWVPGDAGGPLGNLDEVYAVLDDGLVAGSQHLVWALLQAAQRAGVRVVLDGVDGDTVVDHGQYRLLELARQEDWQTFAREARLLAERFAQADHRHNFEETLASVPSVFSYYGRPALDELALTGPAWRYARSLRRAARHVGAYPRKELSRVWRRLLVPARLTRHRANRNTPASPIERSFISRAFAERVGLAGRLAGFHDPFTEETVASVRDRQRAILEMDSLPDALGLTTQMGAVLGLEVAHPFMDRRLVEFCLALPSEQSLREGWTRAILREAVAPTVPPKVTWRVGKADIGAGFDFGLYVLDKERLAEHVGNPGPLVPFIDWAHVDAVYRKGSEATNEEATALARLATLVHWVKQLRAQGVRRSTTGQSGNPPYSLKAG